VLTKLEFAQGTRIDLRDLSLESLQVDQNAIIKGNITVRGYEYVYLTEYLYEKQIIIPPSVGADALVIKDKDGVEDRFKVTEGGNLYSYGYGDLGSLRIGGTEVITSARVLQNVNADAGIITSGRFPLSRMPTAASGVLKAKGLGVDPAFEALVADDIPELDASKITTGVFDIARIPSIDWSRISGNFPRTIAELLSDHDRAAHDALGTGAMVFTEEAQTLLNKTLQATKVKDVDATPVTDVLLKVIDGVLQLRNSDDTAFRTIAVDSVPNLDASKITSGVFDVARIPDLTRSKITDFFTSPFWDNIPDKPSTFPPEAHADTHKDGGSDEVIGVLKTGTTLPTTGQAGQFFLKTDTLEFYYHDGTSWVKVGKLAGLDLDAHASRHDIGGADEIPGLASHASRHLPGGADQLFDQSLNTTDSPTFSRVYANSFRISALENFRIDQYQNFQIRFVNEDEVNKRMFWIGGGAGIDVVISAGDLIVGGVVRPKTDNAYDIGSSSYRWKDGYFAGNLNVGGTANLCQVAVAMGQSSTTALTWQLHDHGWFCMPIDLGKFGSSYFRFDEYTYASGQNHGVRLYNMTDSVALAVHETTEEGIGWRTISIACTPPSGVKRYKIELHSDGSNAFDCCSACLQSATKLRNLFLVEMEEIEEEITDIDGKVKKQRVKVPRGWSKLRFSYGVHVYDLEKGLMVIQVPDFEDAEKIKGKIRGLGHRMDEITQEELRKYQEEWGYIKIPKPTPVEETGGEVM